MRPVYRDEPCRTALNRVRKMSFNWSLNPYMGCVHQCTFCFVRAFERMADRPSDARYGTSIRVKTNLVEVLRRELARRSWKREQVVVGTATDPYQPAEGHYRLTRGAISALGEARHADRDHHPRPADRPGRGRAGGGIATRQGGRDLLDPDAGSPRSGVGPNPARRRPVSACGRSGRSSTRASTRAWAWHRSCPACPMIRRRWPTSCAPLGRGRDLGLDERPVPAAGHPRALPREPGAGLAGPLAAVRAALRRAGVRHEGDAGARPTARSASWRVGTAWRIGDAGPITPPPEPTSEQLPLTAFLQAPGVPPA